MKNAIYDINYFKPKTCAFQQNILKLLLLNVLRPRVHVGITTFLFSNRTWQMLCLSNVDVILSSKFNSNSLKWSPKNVNSKKNTNKPGHFDYIINLFNFIGKQFMKNDFIISICVGNGTHFLLCRGQLFWQYCLSCFWHLAQIKRQQSHWRLAWVGQCF